ncbi:NAD(P)H-binding protein [Streptosporangium roseum]|uniref:NAD(P)H-binding protein n=1 Tax=Streptosporangium roseum TaxID=2001 RepID=UPI00332ADE9D
MTENTRQGTTLVLGGTGKTGRRVVERLAARGLPVRAGSRSGTPPFDWEDRATWAPALRDVESVYVTYYPDLAAPGAAASIGSFAALAAGSGVRRLVLLSGRGEEEAQACERTVQESGAEWTILRASWFSQNFSEHHLLEPVLSGVVALPAGNVAEPFVDVEDIADVAVAVLTQDGHAGRIYELTGPRLLTFTDAAGEIAKAADREVRYIPVSAEEYADALVEHGVPAEEATMLTELFTKVLDGRNAHLADGVRRVLGREPRDFADYARDAAATGVWNG